MKGVVFACVVVYVAAAVAGVVARWRLRYWRRRLHEAVAEREVEEAWGRVLDELL